MVTTSLVASAKLVWPPASNVARNLVILVHKEGSALDNALDILVFGEGSELTNYYLVSHLGLASHV